MNTRWDVINHFIQKNDSKTYLEIGYYKGWSFDNVKCHFKTAVDPFPCKTPKQESVEYGQYVLNTENEKIIKLKSDDFFFQNKNKYDIIFIDGLHEWEQVYRDILNSLLVLNENGTIVLHDCNPPEYEYTNTGINGCWTGDTYKAVLKFQENFDYVFYTYDFDWGVGVITKEIDIKANDKDFYKKGFEDWNFFNKNRKKLLNLKNEQ